MFYCVLKQNKACHKCYEHQCPKWCDCTYCKYFKDGKCTGDPFKPIEKSRWKSCRQGRRWVHMLEMNKECSGTW